MVDLKDKSILFLGIGFYDYDNCIITELKTRGAHITYVKTVPDEVLPRALNRIGCKKIATRLVSRKLYNKLYSIQENFDYIFIIIGDNLNKRHLQLLKSRNAKSKFILYLWDDIKRVPNYNVLAAYCDNIFTFDANDSEVYGLRLRPLFFRISKNVSNFDSKTRKYDYSFVGWNHSIRYDYIHRIRKELDKVGLSYKFILLTRPWLYLWDIFVNRAIFKEDKEIFLFRSMPYNEYIKVTQESKIVIDIPYPSQKGLTIRTIESFALGKKVLTTNDSVTKYNFPTNSYCLLDGRIEDFDFAYPLNDIDINVDMKMFSIHSFIDDLFGN